MIQPNIFKFGGASIKDANAIKNVAELVKARWHEGLVLVISAAGDTTDKLELLIKLAFQNKDFEKGLFDLLDYHYGICQSLFKKDHSIFTKVENHFALLRRSLQNATLKEDEDFFYDQIIGYGELISTRIVQEYLCEIGCPCIWQDARELVSTDSNKKLAKVDWALTMQHCRRILIPELEKFPVITQGFIGKDLLGNTTTLGREGSDFTAAILAVSLGAKSLTIWKDVEGILNGDPDIFPEAVKFEYLDFEEAAEMTYYGAKVIHPKTIKPLAKHGIALHVKSFIHPEAPGTIIGAFGQAPRIPITIIKNKQTLVELRIRDLSMVGKFHFEYLYDAARKLNCSINLLSASAAHLRFLTNDGEAEDERITKTFRDVFHVYIKRNLTLVTVKNPTHAELDHYRKKAVVIYLEQNSSDLMQIVFGD